MSKLDDAIRSLRQDPQHADLVRDAYLGPDVADSAYRFSASEEFRAVRKLLDQSIQGSRVLDVGAGVGIASYAFLKAGAHKVYALEPDRSDLVGLGALRTLSNSHPIVPLQAFSETIPLADEVVDIVYARQVLHHTRDLARALRECARVLRPGGIFVACREHVVKDEADKVKFLEDHVVHQMAGGENAYRLREYTQAITQAGLTLEAVLNPYESVINYFPTPKEQVERQRTRQIRRNLSKWGRYALRIPLLRQLIIRYGDASYPGNMYSFIATKR